MISYDDFAKLEIKIGTILTAEIVEGADKLLRLTVDLGEKNEAGEVMPRQIVSGIREYYPEPAVLIGKQCPFLANLEPRTIRGFESQGMILAASNDNAFALLHPSTELTPGSRVK